jgi:hypothetical protein
MSPHFNNSKQTLNNIVIFDTSNFANVFEGDCRDISIRTVQNSYFFSSTLIMVGTTCNNADIRDSNNILAGYNISRNVIFICDGIVMAQGNYFNSFIRSSSIVLGNSTHDLKIGVGASNIAIGSGCHGISVGLECKGITIGSSETSCKSYCSNINFEDGVQFVNLSPTGTTSSASNYRNVTVSKGVCGTSNTNRKTISDPNVGQDYKTTYHPANSQFISV